MRVAEAFRRFLRIEVSAAYIDEPRQLRVKQRQIEELAFPHTFAHEKRGKNAHRRVDAAAHVGNRDGIPHGFVSRLAGDAHDARFALRENVVSGQPGLRTGPSVAADRAIDQARICRADFLVIKAAFQERFASRLIVDEHIRVRDEVAHDPNATRVIEIQRERSFVPICGEKVGGLGTRERWPPSTRLIPCSRPFDLDDVGAQIAKQHGAVGPGQGFGPFDNTHTVKCLHVFRL